MPCFLPHGSGWIWELRKILRLLSSVACCRPEVGVIQHPSAAGQDAPAALHLFPGRTAVVQRENRMLQPSLRWDRQERWMGPPPTLRLMACCVQCPDIHWL